MKRPDKSSRRTQSQRRKETQEAVLSAAIKLLIDKGHGGFSSSRVAAMAGVSRGALEHYFPTKQDLLAAATRHAMREAVEHAGMLARRAVRSNDSFNDVDFCSSNNSTPCNLQQMRAPLLVTTMGGHYFIRDAEQYFDMAASVDKDYYVIEGATHGGTECTACETTPGQYNNATKNLFDLMASWMNARY